MSTVKTDAITAVSAGGDLSLDGLGTGGVSIASTLKMTKGGDITSASPLVIDTDGNYFDVTGTTNFAAMTVESGNFFMLQFDGALTITHGSGIELPGAANLTTAAGDRLICYATAANTVEVMSVETEAATGGSDVEWLESITLSGNATETFSHTVATGYVYMVDLIAIKFATDSPPTMRLGTGGGPTILTSGYNGSIHMARDTTAAGVTGGTGGFQMNSQAGGTAAGEVDTYRIEFYNLGEAAKSYCLGHGFFDDNGGIESVSHIAGDQDSTTAITAIQLWNAASANADTGVMHLSRRKLS